MKFSIGDKVIINRSFTSHNINIGDEGEIVIKPSSYVSVTLNPDEYWVKFANTQDAVIIAENLLSPSYTAGSGIFTIPNGGFGFTFSQPLSVTKFQVGDRVKYIYNHHSPTLSTGDLGTIQDISPDIQEYYTVKFDNCSFPLLTAGHDLEFVSTGKPLQEPQNLNYKSNASHKCKFNKTYTGLNYKEDMCDCGKGINRRGIYDA